MHQRWGPLVPLYGTLSSNEEENCSTVWGNLTTLTEQLLNSAVMKCLTESRASLAAANQFHASRQQDNSVLFLLCVSNLSSSITEEGLLNMFVLYGSPLSIYVKEDTFGHPVAFIAYANQREADSAIAGLNGKPPLDWAVRYVKENARDEVIPDEFVNGIKNVNRSGCLPDNRFPPCVNCGVAAKFHCRCSTRYCSRECQDLDWRKHKPHCDLPPPLVAAIAAPEILPPQRTSVSPLQASAFKAPRMPNLAMASSPPLSFNRAESRGPMLSRVNHELRKLVSENQTPQSKAVLTQKANLVPSHTTCDRFDIEPDDETQSHLRPMSTKPMDSTKQPFRRTEISPAARELISNVIHNQPGSSFLGPLSKSTPQTWVQHPPSRFSEPDTSTVSATVPLQEAKIYPRFYRVGKPSLANLKSKPVKVCFVKSPEELYIQMKEALPALAELELEIARAVTEAPALVRPSLDQPCLAKFEGDWYRAAVGRIDSDGSVLGVRFVDYGNRALLKNQYEHVRQAELKLCQMEHFAIQVKLAGVAASAAGWDDCVRDQFKILTEIPDLTVDFVSDGAQCPLVKLKSAELGSDDLATFLITKHLTRSTAASVVTAALSDVASVAAAPVITAPSTAVVATTLVVAAPSAPSVPVAATPVVTTPVAATPVIVTLVATTPTATAPVSPVPVASVPLALPAPPVPVPVALSAPMAAAPVVPTPVAPTPVAPTPVAPSPVAPTPVAPTLVVPTPVAPTPVAPTPVAPTLEVPTPVVPTPVVPTPVAPTPVCVPSATTPVAALALPETRIHFTEKPNTVSSTTDFLQEGNAPRFLVAIAFDPNIRVSLGSLLRNKNDADFLTSFHDKFLNSGFADKLAQPVAVGVLAAAFSPQLGAWFRAYILKATSVHPKQSHRVLYVDYGNIEDNVELVRPLPTCFLHPFMAVKVTLVGKIDGARVENAQNRFTEETLHQMIVTKCNEDHTLEARWNQDLQPVCRVRIEPWTTLFGGRIPNSSPASAGVSSLTAATIISAVSHSSVSSPVVTDNPPIIAPVPATRFPMATSVQAVHSSEEALTALQRIYPPSVTPVATSGLAAVSPTVSVTDRPVTKPVPVAPSSVHSIPHRSWLVGTSSEVSIVTATALDSIWVQACSNDILKLTDEIQPALQKLLMTTDAPQVLPSVGSYVGAVFPEDGQLYRAQIQSLNTPNHMAVVRFVDYGNLAEVSIDQIRTLPDELIKVEAYCSRVALVNVEIPLAGTPPSLTDLLLEITDQVFNLLVIETEANGTVRGVLIREYVLNEVITNMLNDSLAVSKAIPITDLQKAAVKPSNVLEPIYYEDGPFVDLPESGAVKLRVLVCQSPKIINITTTDKAIHQKMDDLQVEMTSYAESQLVDFNPSEGEMCLLRRAPSLPSKSATPDWFRAACLRVSEDKDVKSFLLILVDSGEVVEDASVCDLRRIPKRFVTWCPYLAHHAILRPTLHIENVSLQLMERTAQLLSPGSEVDAIIVERNGPAYVVDIDSVTNVLHSESLL